MMATSMEDLRVLKSAENLGHALWQILKNWDSFNRDTMGKQLIRAVDSIGANIAEAFGRFHFSEKINFLYYARGSLFETKYWLNLCHHRKLITDEQWRTYSEQLAQLGKQINQFVGSLKKQRSAANNGRSLYEPSANYAATPNLLSTEDLAWLGSTQSPISNLKSPQKANHD
jgi:four helix bundle protein